MFTKHLDDHGVSYRDHQKLAFFFARESLKVSFVAFVHGIIPLCFETTGSRIHKNILPKYMEMLEAFKNKKK